MTQRRKIEVFTAGCPCCTAAVELVKFLAGTEHDIEIRDMHDPAVAAAASGYGIDSVPAIVIDGRLSDCCVGRGPDESTLAWEIIFGYGPEETAPAWEIVLEQGVAKTRRARRNRKNIICRPPLRCRLGTKPEGFGLSVSR